MLFNFKALVSALLLSTAVFGAEHLAKRDQARGIDVSSEQGDLDWNSVAGTGVSFAYIRATEGTSNGNSYFQSQYDGAAGAGLVRGAYHVPLLDKSTGAVQADYFLSNGGGWTSDGNTLPGALYIQGGPSGSTCYGLEVDAVVSWIYDFSDTYSSNVGRGPVIYTTSDWWHTCTGDYPGFNSTNPLWAAGSGDGFPAGWSDYTFQQNAESGPFGGEDVFNGDDLGSFADN